MVVVVVTVAMRVTVGDEGGGRDAGCCGDGNNGGM